MEGCAGPVLFAGAFFFRFYHLTDHFADQRFAISGIE
jgi:hypothetical protein